MLIKIINVLDKTLDNSIRVKLIYDLRNSSPPTEGEVVDDSKMLVGTWVGKMPQKDKWYDVEISIDNLVWGLNVFETKQETALIVNESNGNILLQGQLDVSESGFVTMRIGRSILVCNLTGISGPINTLVQIHTTKIAFYDTDTLRY